MQSDGQAVYFAIQRLFGTDPADFPSRWVWVRNLRPAPLMFAEPGTEAGAESNRLPLVPESYCVHAQGRPPLDLEQTRVVWFEQGIGAMLIEGEDVLAIIPPQPNHELPGFSAECRLACALATPLDDDDLYLRSAAAISEYWTTWVTSNPMADWHQAVVAELSALGEITNEFSVMSEAWPPLRIVQLTRGDAAVYLVTVGMALRCQPMVERELLNFEDHQRLELAVPVPAGTSGADIEAMAGWLAGLARYPWQHETCFLPTQKLSTRAPMTPLSVGAASESDSTSSTSSTGATSSTNVTDTKLQFTITPEAQAATLMNRAVCRLPNFRQQTVNLLWLL